MLGTNIAMEGIPPPNSNQISRLVWKTGLAIAIVSVCIALADIKSPQHVVSGNISNSTVSRVTTKIYTNARGRLGKIISNIQTGDPSTRSMIVAANTEMKNALYRAKQTRDKNTSCSSTKYIKVTKYGDTLAGVFEDRTDIETLILGMDKNIPDAKKQELIDSIKGVLVMRQIDWNDFDAATKNNGSATQGFIYFQASNDRTQFKVLLSVVGVSFEGELQEKDINVTTHRLIRKESKGYVYNSYEEEYQPITYVKKMFIPKSVTSDEFECMMEEAKRDHDRDRFMKLKAFVQAIGGAPADDNNGEETLMLNSQ